MINNDGLRNLQEYSHTYTSVNETLNNKLVIEGDLIEIYRIYLTRCKSSSDIFTFMGQIKMDVVPELNNSM